MRKTEAERRAESLQAVAERQAAWTPEVRLIVETSLANLHSNLVRWFCGEEGEHEGYMPSFTATPDEMRAFRTATPATHIWAAWEREVSLDF